MAAVKLFHTYRVHLVDILRTSCMHRPTSLSEHRDSLEGEVSGVGGTAIQHFLPFHLNHVIFNKTLGLGGDGKEVLNAISDFAEASGRFYSRVPVRARTGDASQSE